MDTAYVYVIGFEDGPKKIGMSMYPISRKAGLNVENYREMYCFYSSRKFPRWLARKVELQAQLSITDKRSSFGSEWFDVTFDEAIKAVVASMTFAGLSDVSLVPETRRIIVNIDACLHMQAKMKARDNGDDIDDVIRRALREWVS